MLQEYTPNSFTTASALYLLSLSFISLVKLFSQFQTKIKTEFVFTFKATDYVQSNQFSSGGKSTY